MSQQSWAQVMGNLHTSRAIKKIYDHVYHTQICCSITCNNEKKITFYFTGNDSYFSSQHSKHDPKKDYDTLIASISYSEISSL